MPVGEPQNFAQGYQQVICLFCQTGREALVAGVINANEWGRAIFPQRVKTVIRKGQWSQAERPLLPGYVFVYQDGQDFDYGSIRRLSGVIKVLTYDDTGMHQLRGEDLKLADWFWQKGGVIGPVEAIQLGDRVEIVDGVFKQLRGRITRMDRRRKTFCIELDGAGSIRSLWLTYEVVKKLEDEHAQRLDGMLEEKNPDGADGE